MRFVIKNLRDLGSQENMVHALLWLMIDSASFFVLSVGVLALVGYNLDLPGLHQGWSRNSPDMAAQTAACFAVTGAVLLTLNRSKR